LLLLLVRERGRAVSTQELFSVLWPGERVGMGSVRRAVLGVRRALGEMADAQHSVRTVRGFGYQFVRPVRVAGSPAETAFATPASAWEAGVGRGMAETLPLYGRAAELVREEALRGWERRVSTGC
jgi:DNA-binding winged helix-turn-helix (wHTH) protein